MELVALVELAAHRLLRLLVVALRPRPPVVAPRHLRPLPETLGRLPAQPGLTTSRDFGKSRVGSQRAGRQSVLTISAISSPASVGLSPTSTPASRSASIFAAAVPLPPETMAPAWPIFLPAGAVTPAT